MKIEKKQLFYLGIGVFIALIIINSKKGNTLQEISDDKVNATGFDPSKLPSKLKPPKMLGPNEKIPVLEVKKKSFHTLFAGSKNIFH